MSKRIAVVERAGLAFRKKRPEKKSSNCLSATQFVRKEWKRRRKRNGRIWPGEREQGAGAGAARKRLHLHVEREREDISKGSLGNMGAKQRVLL